MRRLLPIILALFALLGASLAAAPAASAAYPGRDGKIAFVRANQIYTINPNGSGIQQLTTAAKNYRPKYSPNGTRIAYIHETAAGAKDIWVMRANGSNKQQVTHLGNVSTNPTWSGDGAWIAFGTPLRKIRSTAPFGQPVQMLGHFNEGDPDFAIRVLGSLAWSPDGQRIAYYTDQGDDSPDNYLQIYDVASHDISTWTVVGGECCGEGYYGDFAWSASGARLGYTDGWYNPEDTPQQPPPIVSIDTYPGHVSVAFATERGDKQPAFAPAAGRVLLMNGSTGVARIFVAQSNGSGRRLLTNGYQPDWQPLP